MTPKTIILLISSAAALSFPAAGSAQSYYGQQYRAQPYYGQRGDYNSRRRAYFSGYPEFRGLEAHIRSEISDGVRNDMLAPDDAADLGQQLRAIQARELREYRVHGWNLPENDRAAIRSQLDDLDRVVDETRNEP